MNAIVQLNWDSNSNTDGFNIYVNGGQVASGISGYSTSHTINLGENSGYQVEIEAYNNYGTAPRTSLFVDIPAYSTGGSAPSQVSGFSYSIIGWE